MVIDHPLSNIIPVYLLWPGPNFIELLKHKILLKQKNHCLVKSDCRPRLHLIVMLSKQQLNTNHKQCIWHDILASNMCKTSELFSCLSKQICLSSSMKLAPGINLEVTPWRGMRFPYLCCDISFVHIMQLKAWFSLTPINVCFVEKGPWRNDLLHPSGVGSFQERDKLFCIFRAPSRRRESNLFVQVESIHSFIWKVGTY